MQTEARPGIGSKYYRFLEDLGSPAFLLEPDTEQVVGANRQGLALLNRDFEQVSRMTWADFFSGGDDGRPALELAEAEETRVFYCDIAKRTDKSVPAKVEVSNATLGSRQLFLVRITDITERRQAEEALRESESLFSCLATHCLDGLCIHEDGKVLLANQAYCDIFGFSPTEMIGISSYAFIAPESRDDVYKKVSSAYDKAYEALCIKRDGTTFVAEIHGTKAQYRGREVRISVLRDITGQKKARDSARLHTLQMNRAQEEERKRIARDLHDGTIQSLASLILDLELAIRKEASSPELSHSLQHACDDARHIIQEVRSYCHELRPDVLDKLDLTAAVEALCSDLNRKGIRTFFDVSGTTRELQPDAELMIFRIVQEATRNIWRHSHAAQATVSVFFASKTVRLIVEDNGVGFPTPRTSGDQPLEGKLGLVGMKERAKSVGGTLIVRSASGKGTRIIFEADL